MQAGENQGFWEGARKAQMSSQEKQHQVKRLVKPRTSSVTSHYFVK